jgi:Fe-S-cluster containining protein
MAKRSRPKLDRLMRRPAVPPVAVGKPSTSPSPTSTGVLSVAAAKAPWYHPGIRFGCTQCGACCRIKGYVWLGGPDIARMADFLKLSIDEFRARYVQEHVIEGQDERGLSLVKVPHGCVFLDDATNQCTLHDARPTQCRTFPFWPMALESPEAWEREVVSLCGREALEQGRVYTVEEIVAQSSRISRGGSVRREHEGPQTSAD